MLNGQNIPLARYQFDALDRLTGQDQHDGVVSQRFYCESRLATEIKAGDGHSIFQHGEQVMAQHRHAGGRLHSTLLGTDMQGSVLHLLHPNDPHARGYSAYGHHPIQNFQTLTLGFNGQRPDPLTGHYLLGNGYRAFNPILMRFNSPDSLSPFLSGGLNAYAYCKGDPVNSHDPSGRTPRLNALRAAEKRTLGEYGTRFKRMLDVEQISPGIKAGVDLYQNHERLTVIGSGGRGFILADKDARIDARELLKLLEVKGFDVKGFKNIRLISCFSANKLGGSPSLAQEFANITTRPVKGFYNKVGSQQLDVNKEYKSMWFGMLKGKTPQSKAFLEHGSGGYRRRIFLPEMASPSASEEPNSNIRR